MAILVAIINSTYDTSLNSFVAGLASVLAVAPKVCVQLRLFSVSHGSKMKMLLYGFCKSAELSIR